MKFLIALFFLCSLNAKRLPSSVSESRVVFNPSQRDYMDTWYRLNKFDPHTLIIDLSAAKPPITSFRVELRDELQTFQWYRDEMKNPQTRRLEDKTYPLEASMLILQFNDDRPFSVFEAEQSKKQASPFVIRLDFESSSKKYPILIRLEQRHQNPPLPYPESRLKKWFEGNG